MGIFKNASKRLSLGKKFELLRNTCFYFSVPPQRPRIEFNGTQVLPGHNLTTFHGELAVIKCVSHYGNPPPILKWFLGECTHLISCSSRFKLLKKTCI